jgi:hypothetical protein
MAPKVWLIFGTDEGEIDLIIKKILGNVKNDLCEVFKIDDISGSGITSMAANNYQIFMACNPDS